MAEEVKQIGQLYGTEVEPNPQAGRVYDKTGISPCLDSMRGGATGSRKSWRVPLTWKAGE